MKKQRLQSAQGGYPEHLVKWSLQYRENNSQHFLDLRDVHATAEQDPQDHLYSFNSTIDICASQYRSLTCLICNPTLNLTTSATHVLNKGKLIEAVQSSRDLVV